MFARGCIKSNVYIMGPSENIIHIWSNLGFSDISYTTTFLPAQMSVVLNEVYCIIWLKNTLISFEILIPGDIMPKHKLTTILTRLCPFLEYWKKYLKDPELARSREVFNNFSSLPCALP